MTKLINPFEILNLNPGKVFLPELPRDESITYESILDVPVNPGSFTSGRLIGVTGLPGTGKTHRLLNDVQALNNFHRKAKFCQVTSLNNTTVNEVKHRQSTNDQEGLARVQRHMTLHKIAYYDMGGEEHCGSVKMKRKVAPKYLTEEFTEESREQYVKDAPHRGAKRELAGAFKEWNPTEEPLPEDLSDRSALPQEFGYDYTLFRVCLEYQERFLRGDLVGSYQRGPFKGALLIDEAQDLSPLHAIVLGWYALEKHFYIRFYGDPNQMMDQDRKLPFLWEQGGKVEEFYGLDKYRRVPLQIAELAEMVLPGLVAPAEKWCKRDEFGRLVHGQIIPVPPPANGKQKRKPIEVSQGFSIHESRYRVNTGCKYVAPGVSTGCTVEAVEKPKREGRPHVVISTAFMVKGREHEVVTLQPMLPKHVAAYLRGDLQTRRRVYVAITRSKGRLIIHQEMLDMINEGANQRWD